MCSLRDAADDFRRLNVTVYGISLDDVRSQASFKKQLGLGFALRVVIARPYGLLDAGLCVVLQDFRLDATQRRFHGRELM